MLMKMRSKMQNQKGFTLVELMVVVVILGILVAIAVPVYNSVQERAEINACHANARTIDGMAAQWNLMEASERPATFAGMFEEFPTCPASTATTPYSYSKGGTALTGTETGVIPDGKATCSLGTHGTY